MPRNINRFALSCALLAFAAAAEGCQHGPTWNLAPVEGTVTKVGRPLAGIQVEFRADAESGTQGPRASGLTNAAGHYELRTDAGGRGAAIGRYRVCLRVPDDRTLPRQAKDRAAKPPASEAVQLPPVYSSFKETPLRIEVQPGPQVIDLEIK